MELSVFQSIKLIPSDIIGAFRSGQPLRTHKLKYTIK